MDPDDETEPSFLDSAKEFGATAVKSAMRTADAGLRLIDPSIPTTDHPSSPMTAYSEADRAAAEAHPVATGLGQAFVAAPLSLTPGGVVAGVLGEAAAGGYAAEAEDAWQQNRDFLQEAAFQNVGAGLLIGTAARGAVQVAGKVAAKLGRNLFTEAEHAASSRAGRELLDRAPKAGSGATADEIARLHPDEPGVRYLRENASSLHDEIAASQAKAAQDLLDTYGAIAPLRAKPAELAEIIPDNGLEQARWVTRARDEIGAALDEVDPRVAAPLRERLATLADGDDPAVWFTRASELSDELLKAESKAGPAADQAAFDLTGMSHADLGADKLRPGALSFFRKDAEFAETGVPSKGGIGRTSQGDHIKLRQRSPDGKGPLKGEGLFLVDGSNRLQVAREKGLETLPAIVQDADGNEIFRGRIPIGGAR